MCFMFMYFKCFISIYICNLSSYDYVWGIITYSMVLLRFCFFSKKKEKKKDWEEGSKLVAWPQKKKGIELRRSQKRRPKKGKRKIKGKGDFFLAIARDSYQKGKGVFYFPSANINTYTHHAEGKRDREERRRRRKGEEEGQEEEEGEEAYSFDFDNFSLSKSFKIIKTVTESHAPKTEQYQ